ncbi:MAG: DUF1599 domain-containing protein [Bacteroidales bacterium]|nr:DUF1599 domain-containing protein [Bacteroidales bacterium]
MNENAQKDNRTRVEIEREATVCRRLFEDKTRDYGTAWRVLRLPSLTDQIYIKACRIRTLQDGGENRVGDDVRGEFVAMVNYAVMALMQLSLTDDAPIYLPLDEALRLYDAALQRPLTLMLDKNHDYDEAWRRMRVSSMLDLILMKILRIKQIEDNSGSTLVSEGVEGGYMDIVNYSLFCLVRLAEEEQNNG